MLSWWGNENEYFNRVFVRRRSTNEPWREADGGETACVWDIQIISFERDAYVETILTPPTGPDIEAYLARQLEVAV